MEEHSPKSLAGEEEATTATTDRSPACTTNLSETIFLRVILVKNETSNPQASKIVKHEQMC